MHSCISVGLPRDASTSACIASVILHHCTGGFVHEEELLQEGALTHRRGTNSYVFIPEEELQTHIFNNPELDYFIAG